MALDFGESQGGECVMAKTKLEKATVKAIRDWCIANNDKPISRLRHVYPRCYVLGRAAESCLIVACPPIDAEPQIKKARKVLTEDGSTSIHLFDKTLKAGDWCSVAYVCFSPRQERVAIHAVQA